MIDYSLINPLLNSLTDVTALTGSRIYPMVIPTDPVLPAITYQVIGGIAKPSFNTAGLRKYRVQFDCWGLSYIEASEVRTALVMDLDGFTGTINDVFIQDCQFIQPIDRFVPDLLQYICAAEFYIFTTA